MTRALDRNTPLTQAVLMLVGCGLSGLDVLRIEGVVTPVVKLGIRGSRAVPWYFCVTEATPVRDPNHRAHTYFGSVWQEAWIPALTLSRVIAAG